MRNVHTLFSATLVIAVIALAGCGSRANEEFAWARAALARNPNLEILAADESKGEFTVRERATGEVRTMRVDEIAAAPATAPAAAAAEAAPAANEALAAAQDASAPMVEGEAATAAEEAREPTDEPMPVVSEPASAAAASAPGAAANGKLVAAGPGYSITRTGGATTAAADTAPTRPIATEPARAEPIICQGQRFMRIDGRTLESSSNAIVAENGCDLHITNAHIRADGIALVVRDARVHITNSTLTGGTASLEAAGTAEVFMTGSTFTGITRRFDAAVVNDLGGNQYR